MPCLPMQDVVVIFVTVCGWKDRHYMQETYANKVYSGARPPASDEDPLGRKPDQSDC